MRDWLIRKLGGYTEKQYSKMFNTQVALNVAEMERRDKTIASLSALVPVYPLTAGENSVVADVPKKKRPRKYAGKA